MASTPRSPFDGLSSDRELAPAIEAMLNQVAHDVRNHAFTIALQAELGERAAQAQPEARARFVAVLRQVDHLKAYLEKLLLFGRPVALRPAEVDVGDLVRAQVHSLQHAWNPGGPPLAIHVDVGDAVGVTRWDARYLGAALLALLDNAARSADPPPPITVAVARAGGIVTIEVADRGTGIPDDKLTELWIPMKVRRHGGTGLGLATARKLVAAHGGSMELETSAAGTVVRLRLPAEVGAG
jgi:signal transduction histidine kinase